MGDLGFKFKMVIDNILGLVQGLGYLLGLLNIRIYMLTMLFGTFSGQFAFSLGN